MIDHNIEERNYIVYKHTTPSGKMYIGITGQSPQRRWGKDGCRYLHQTQFGYTHFGKAIVKYGWDNIQHDILFEHLTKNEAIEKEKELISKYKTNNSDYGYNLTSGGECTTFNEEVSKKLSLARKGHIVSEETREKLRIANTGHKHSPETLLKLSLTHKGKQSPRKGHKCSLEEKQHMSEAHKGINIGHIVSKETRKKISETHKGMKTSLETRLKQSLAKKGKVGNRLNTHQSEETRKKISEANKGLIAWNKGKELSEEHRRKLSESTKEYWRKKKAGELKCQTKN